MTTGDNDLSPVAHTTRTFACWDFASLWIGLVVSVPIYYLAGSLVQLGMTWWQGVATIVLANAVLLIPLLLTAVPGTRHGISFPVLARSAFGLRGAQVPTLIRALVACGWFGIDTWIGSQTFLLLLPPSWAGRPPLPWLGTSLPRFSCFMAFWVVQMAVLWKGMEGVRVLGRYAAPLLIALTAALFSWALVKAGGLGEMLAPTPSLPSSQFWALFFPSLTANVGSWSGMALSIPDFSRYAKTQRDQIAGQLGLPLFMGAFTFVGLAVTSASAVIYGAPISDPVLLVREIVRNSSGVVGAVVSLVAVVGISIATITTNVPANVVTSANVLVDLDPSLFTFGKAALVTGIVGLVFQPWRVFQSSGSFVQSWLVGYASITGPISGILLVDYYVVQRMELDVRELYSTSKKGRYYYWNGFNLNGMVALVVSCAPMVPGFLQQVGVLGDVGFVLRGIYGVSWFFGFFLASLLYWVLCSCFHGGSACKGEDIEQRLLTGSEGRQP